MNWIWLNLAGLVVFFGLVLHGAPVLPVAAGVAAAALLHLSRRRVKSD